MRSFIIACVLMCVVGCGGESTADEFKDSRVAAAGMELGITADGRSFDVGDTILLLRDLQRQITENRYFTLYPDTKIEVGKSYEFAGREYIRVKAICDGMAYIEYAEYTNDGDVKTGMYDRPVDDDYAGYKEIPCWNVGYASLRFDGHCGKFIFGCSDTKE